MEKRHREVLQRSVVEKCWRGVGEESCRGMLGRSLVEKRCRDVL